MEKDNILIEITSQEELNEYIRKLPTKAPCIFMIEWATNICGCEFICPYKGRDQYAFRGEQKRECMREKILFHKKLLGVKP